MDTKKRGSLIVFLSSLLWATDNPFRAPLYSGGLSVPFVGFLEHLLNGIASLPALFKYRLAFKNLSAKHLCGLFYIGAGASALASLWFFYGAAAMNYNFTVAALLQKFQPLFAIILAAIFLKEKIGPKFWLLAVPALLGGYLVSFGNALPMSLWQSAGHVSIKGPGLAILAALFWAGGTVVGRSMLSDLNFQFVTGMRFIFGFLFLLAYVPFAGGMQFFLMTGFFWRNVVIISLVSGFFALLLYYYGLRSTKASVATLMELGYPLALTIVNWKFLGITLNPWQIAGAIILLASATALVFTGGNFNEPVLAAEKSV